MKVYVLIVNHEIIKGVFSTHDKAVEYLRELDHEPESDGVEVLDFTLDNGD